MAETDFEQQIANWTPAQVEGDPDDGPFQEWRINGDGSLTITLPPFLAANLGEMLREWHGHGEPAWMFRDDCKNWKRSPIARENRRETIVYGNLVGQLACYLGRREVRALMGRVEALKREEQP